MVGAPGTVTGGAASVTTVCDGADSGPRPIAFRAAAVQVYVLSPLRCTTRTGDFGSLSACAAPPSLETHMARYETIFAPPLLAERANATVTPSVAAVTVVMPGAPGPVAGVAPAAVPSAAPATATAVTSASLSPLTRPPPTASASRPLARRIAIVVVLGRERKQLFGSGPPDPAQVAVEIRPNPTYEADHAAVTGGDLLDDVVGQQDAHVGRLHPLRSFVLVADPDRAAVADRPPVRELEHVVAVDVHRIAAHQLELAVDLDAGFLLQLAAGGVLGQLVGLDQTPGQEELAGQRGAPRPFQQEDLVPALGIHHRRERVHR